MRAIKLPLLLIFVVLTLGVGGIVMPRGAIGDLLPSKAVQPRLEGSLLPSWRAPDFRLTDQFGKTVSMAALRGRPVVLTLMEAHCTEVCPVAAETLRRTLEELGTASRGLTVLALTADPEGDTPGAVRAFSTVHGMWNRWLYLTASRTRLAPLWRALRVYVAPKNAPAQLRAAHTSATFLIDKRGRERVLFTDDPDGGMLIRDLRILLGLPVATPVSHQIPAAEFGHPAPSFQLTTLSGSPVSLTSLRGKVVLLNFWATWCTACRSEMPRLQSWYQRLQSRNFVVLGVDGQGEGAGAVSHFLRGYHVTYPVALDGGDVSARYNVFDLPTSVLLNRRGVVASINIGALDPKYLSAQIVPLLGAGYDR